jgi:hypothetical protein
MTEPVQTAEIPIWRSYPSWAHFMWLYFFGAMAAFRGILFLRFGLEGGEGWLIGAVALVATAAAARRWAENVLTSTRPLVRNGYTGREIQSLPLADIGDITIHQGPVAGFFDIGTIVLRSRTRDKAISLKGVKHPDVLVRRIQALMPNGNAMPTVHEGFL